VKIVEPNKDGKPKPENDDSSDEEDDSSDDGESSDDQVVIFVCRLLFEFGFLLAHLWPLKATVAETLTWTHQLK